MAEEPGPVVGEPDESDFEGEVRYRGRPRWIAVLVAVVAAVGVFGASIAVLIGEGDDDSSSEETTDDPQVDGRLTLDDLAGRTFLVVAMEHDGDPVPLAADRPSLAFGDGTVVVDDGCNGHTSNVAVIDEGLIFFEGDSTQVGCEGDSIEAQVDAVGDLFFDVSTMPMEDRVHPRAHLTGDILDLRLRDHVGWAVDVTTQHGIGAVPAMSASDAVLLLLDHLARDEWEAAVDLLSAYPAGEDPTAKRAVLEEMRAVHPWLDLLGPRVTISTTPSFSWSEPERVVTVLSETDDDGVRHAAAFLVSQANPARVERIPLGESGFSVEPGSAVSPGDVIVLDAVPVEGGATVHVNGVEVPATNVHEEPFVTTFTVPHWARGEIVVTVSIATPELPGVYAAWYPVER